MTTNPEQPAATKPAIFTPDQLAEIAKAIEDIRQQKGGSGEIVIGFRKSEVSYINCTKFRSFNKPCGDY